MVYGLLSFPFLLFVTPMVGQGLHRARATAYDEQGRLVPKLSDGMIKEKLKAMEEEGKAKPAKKSWLRRNLAPKRKAGEELL